MIRGLFILGLWASLTNWVYISALPAVFALLWLPFLLFRCAKAGISACYTKISAHPVFVAAILFYILALLSVMIYYPQSLLSFNFYRYDGNFIVSYAVFLLLPWFRFDADIKKIIEIFLLLILVTNIPTIWQYFSQQSPYYYGLFSSTNAAGGFFSLMLAVIFAYQLHFQKKWIWLASALVLILLVMTTSRGSMLALSAAIITWYLVDKKGKKWFAALTIFVIVVIQSGLIAHYYDYYDRKIDYLSYQEYRQLQYKNKKEENIYNRLINSWPRAWDAFSRSPITGYGFGSLNDLPFASRQQQLGWLNMNDSSNKVFSDDHGHHSYLHIMAELGIIGLMVLLWFWYQQYVFLHRQKHLPWLRNGLLISFWLIIYSSFTEHRITTPAMLIPYSLLFLFYYGLRR